LFFFLWGGGGDRVDTLNELIQILEND